MVIEQLRRHLLSVRLIMCVAGVSSCAPTYATVTSASAQQAPVRSGWVRVAEVPIGTMLRVEQKSSTLTIGRLEAVDADGVRISTNGSVVDVATADVRRVAMIAVARRGRLARRGFFIGGAAGIVQAAFTTESNRGWWMFFLGGVWGGIGAAMGAVSGGERATVIYEA